MIKRKMKKSLKLVIVIFLIINYYCYFLLPMPALVNQLNSYKMKYGIAAVSVISFIWFMVKKLLKLKLSRPLCLIIALYLIVAYNVIFSLVKYGIHAGIGRGAYPFLICLLFFPVQELLRTDSYLQKAVQYLSIINVAACVLLIMQSILYSEYQIVFMHIPSYEMQGKIELRNGSIRITFLDTMLLFSLFLSMDQIGNRTETSMDIWNVIFSLCAVYFVSQTRSEILICFVCLAVCVIKRNSKMKLKNIFIFIGLFVGIFVFASYVGKYVMEKFTSVSAVSISTRFDELEYYLALFHKNPLSGYGMIDPQQGDIESYKKIVHGPLMKFSITDIGIIGQISRSGVFMLIWYLYFIQYIFRKEHLKIHTCMSIFILLSSINLVILDAARIITLPLVFALYEMDNKQKFVS